MVQKLETQLNELRDSKKQKISDDDDEDDAATLMVDDREEELTRREVDLEVRELQLKEDQKEVEKLRVDFTIALEELKRLKSDFLKKDE